LKFFNRGLYALILTIFFQTQLVAEYLYKDEIVDRITFTEQVEELGSELYEKTGIKLILVMLKNLPLDMSIVEYEKELLKTLSTPTIVLILSRDSSEVDIQVSDASLYKYFNRKQILSPVASAVQAFIIAVMYGDTWEHFNDLRTDYGGSIMPLITGKSKPEQTVGKYAGSMFNGYIDIAHQVSSSKGVVLENDPGDTNQVTLFYVKVFFYGFVLYGVIMYIRRVLYRRRHKNGQK
jgi:oligoribonuclease NrnB/cAMP/cGMP phosphodiesterase (DHH superfamily)